MADARSGRVVVTVEQTPESIRWAAEVAAGRHPAPLEPGPADPTLDEWAYITSERLTTDALALARRVPADVDAVVAVSRSGLVPGGLIAYARHLRLYTVSQMAGVVDPGHGGRLVGLEQRDPAHVLLVDDTVASGREMTGCVARVRDRWPGVRITRAVVYAHPGGRHAVDLCSALLPGLHYLDWNWPNAGHGAACAYDFDGILCRDPSREEDDNGERYRAFLASAEPLYLPRRKAVPLIVTARHERWRAETQAWLDRWGVRCERLVMRDFDPDPSSTWPEQMGSWKGRIYRESECSLFAESEPEQAGWVHRTSRKPVLCPSAAKVWPGLPAEPDELAELGIVPRADIDNCPHRTNVQAGCQCWADCRLHGKRVDLRACTRCLKDQRHANRDRD